MKKLKLAFWFFVFGMICANVQANGNIIQTVPFDNILLNPKQTIQATFNFGPHQMIFCYDNTLQTQGAITWPYQGKIFTTALPVFLKTNPNVQGNLSDPSGTLYVFNNTPNVLVVSCDFGY